MSKEIYFKDVAVIGDLFLEEVFNIFENENLVFTCVDNKEQRYLCVCYEMRQTLEWIICSIDEDILIKVIRNKNDILHAYQVAKKLIQIKFDGEHETSMVVNYDTFDHKLFPDPGVFLKLDLDKTIQYLIRFNYYENLPETKLNIDVKNYFCNFHLTRIINEPIIANQNIKLSYEIKQNPKQENTNNSNYNEDSMLAA